MMLFQNIMKPFKKIIQVSSDDDTILIVGHGCSLYGFIKSLLPQQSFKFPNNATAMIVDYVDETFSLKKVLDPMI